MGRGYWVVGAVRLLLSAALAVRAGERERGLCVLLRHPIQPPLAALADLHPAAARAHGLDECHVRSRHLQTVVSEAGWDHRGQRGVVPHAVQEEGHQDALRSHGDVRQLLDAAADV